MRVFVSGEEGLLASSLCNWMRAHGHEIVNDRLLKTWLSPRWGMGGANKRLTLPEVDVLNPWSLQEIERSKPDVIVHAAAVVNTDKCLLDPHAAWRCNVETTFNMAQVAKKVGARLVYLSTTSVYDPWGARPYHEHDRVLPYTIYGQTKYVGEEVCRRVYGHEGLLILRPCFVYGGRKDTSSTLAKVVRAVLWDEEPVEVLLDPRFKKDYMWVGDFVTQAASLILSDRARGIFNVARAHPRPFGEAVRILVTNVGAVDKKIIWRPDQDYMQDHVVEPIKSRDYTGYWPRVDLEEGVAWMVADLKEERG